MPSAWPSDSTIWLGRRQHPHAAHGRHHQVFGGGCKGGRRLVFRYLDIFVLFSRKRAWTTLNNYRKYWILNESFSDHNFSWWIAFLDNKNQDDLHHFHEIAPRLWPTWDNHEILPTVSERPLKNAAWKCYLIQHAVETGLVSCSTYPQHVLVGFREKVIGPIGMKSYMKTSSENQLFIDWPWLCSFKQIKIQESWWYQGA